MTIGRIKEIQAKTAYPESVSVYQALLQVRDECEQEQLRLCEVSGSLPTKEEMALELAANVSFITLSNKEDLKLNKAVRYYRNGFIDCYNWIKDNGN